MKFYALILSIFLYFCVMAMGETASSSPSLPGPIIRGVVSSKFHRPICKAKDPVMAKRLERFQVPKGDFWFKKRLIRVDKDYRVWLITFPSPFKSSDAANNVVWGEYFQSLVKNGEKEKTGVVVLHPLDQRVGFVQRECSMLARAGMDCIWIRMAYFGQRSSSGFAKQLGVLQDMDLLVDAICQTVMDFRRATELLCSQSDIKPDRVYLCGGSLGALVGSLVMGVDGGYSKAVLLLGGCNLPRIFSANEWLIRSITFSRKEIDLSQESLRRMMEPIEPLTYISRAKGVRVLMCNTREDGVIPPVTSRELASHLDKVECKWYDGGHESLPMREVEGEVVRFFR